MQEGRTGRLTCGALGPCSTGDRRDAGMAPQLGPRAVVARGTELTAFPRRRPRLRSEGARRAEKGAPTAWTPVAWRTQVAFEGGETCGKSSRQGIGAALPVPPKPLASRLESASHLGTRRGARRDRDGTPPDSGLLLRPGRCAPGRPGGSPCLQGSSGRPGRGGQPGPLQSRGSAPSPSRTSQGASRALSQQCSARVPHRLCTSARRGKARSPLAARPQGRLPRCEAGTGWAPRCPLGSRNLRVTGDTGRTGPRGRQGLMSRGPLLAQELRGLDPRPGSTCFGVCQVSRHLTCFRCSYYILDTCDVRNHTHTHVHIKCTAPGSTRFGPFCPGGSCGDGWAALPSASFTPQGQ